MLTNNSLGERSRCECHECTQARYHMSNPPGAALQQKAFTPNTQIHWGNLDARSQYQGGLNGIPWTSGNVEKP